GEVLGELKQLFRPELLGRIDEIIPFEPLTAAQTAEIARRLLARLQERLSERELSLSVSEEAIAAIVNNGSDPLYGARPLRQTIRRQVEDPLAKRLLGGEFTAGETVFLDFREGTFLLSTPIAPASH
ncbi:MAG: hypothetical protein IIX68_03125, partial [Clostridia bacterium]|nr:hypothetical protein [Clostridia bacterium]